jgi:meso-butanediol dehydrogenase/(S,S)-butanediol dehydrogenase/diacetyl reductase
MRGLTGKKAFITGAASGIGRSTAERFAEEEVDLYLVDMNSDGLEETAATCRETGVDVLTELVDVRSDEACDAAIAAAVAHHGRLDIVCNIAGVQRWARSHEHSTEDFQLMLDVNIGGTFFCSRAAIPHLLETKGCIINTASTTSFDGLPYSAVYSATKGAVLMMTKSMGLEYAAEGVRVNAVAPGGITTGMSTEIAFPEGIDFNLVMRQNSPMGMQPPTVISGVVAFLASDDASHINAETILVDGAAIA